MSAKTKEKMLKILQGRNAQDGKEQKKQMVRLEWNLIEFFLLRHLCSELVPYMFWRWMHQPWTVTQVRWSLV